MKSLDRRPLGQSGIEVSRLGLGTVQLGRTEGVKYPNRFTLPDDDAVMALLADARALGINLLDTAPAYGESETRLGKLMGSREDWVLCTKVGEEFENGQSRFDFSGAHIRYSVERSLRRLHTDYLDIVLIHSDGNDLHILHDTDCLAMLQRLKEAGSIRAFGMSTKTIEGGLLAAQLTDVVMVTLNTQSQDDRPVIRKAAELGRGILIKKGLSSGHLVRPAASQEDPVFSSFELIFSEPGVDSVIVGTINPQHLRQNTEYAIRVLTAA